MASKISEDCDTSAVECGPLPLSRLEVRCMSIISFHNGYVLEKCHYTSIKKFPHLNRSLVITLFFVL